MRVILPLPLLWGIFECIISWRKQLFLNNNIKDFRRRRRARRIMKCIISITSEFGLILSLIAQTGNTSCFALIFISSNFVIQLTHEIVSRSTALWLSRWAIGNEAASWAKLLIPQKIYWLAKLSSSEHYFDNPQVYIWWYRLLNLKKTVKKIWKCENGIL